MTSRFATVGLLLVTFSLAWGQQRLDTMVGERNRPLFFHELNWILLPDQQVQISFHFRISNDYLAFVNQNQADHNPSYKAEIRLNLQIRTADSSFLQFSESFSETTSTIAATQDRYQFLEGSIVTTASSLPDSWRLDLTDLNNNTQLLKEAKRGKIEKPDLPGFLNVWILSKSDSVYKPANLDKSVTFGSSDRLVLTFADTTNISQIKPILLHRIPGESTFQPVDSIPAGSLQPVGPLPVRLTSRLVIPVNGYTPTIETGLLDAGRYGLLLKSNGQSDTLFFGVTWLDMPFSLKDLDIATRVMRYLATDDEFDLLTSGSAQKRIENFRTFWRKRDPSPATRYNELMHEYYRRVDFSYLNFQSSRNPGWRTDRGKIYILFGKPDQQIRETPPNQPPQERWIYSASKRTFLFVDIAGKGEYLLQSTVR